MSSDPAYHPALAAARSHAPGWPQGLTALLDREDTSVELRAAAIEALTRAHPRHLLARFMDLIQDPDPRVRLATVRAASILVPEDRVKVAGPALTDPEEEVRLAAGRVLVGAEEELPGERAPHFVTARDEWIESRRADSGGPDAWSELATLYAQLGRGDDAERSLRRALELDQARTGDWANLADLYEATGRSGEAREALVTGLSHQPDSPALIHSRGLAHIRAGEPAAALADLARAVELAPESPRFAYVHVVALADLEGGADPLETLESALARHPRDPELLSLAVSLYEGQGDRESALVAARTLEESDPGNPEYQALVIQLSVGG
ncbi:MAG: HEAT repeat domain-containing protein [Gemmatimonadota bacterium]